MGRPSSFTPDLAERICSLISEGNSIRKVGDREDMPAENTIRRWLYTEGEGFDAFRAQYARACDARAEMLGEELIDIVDGPGDAADKRVRFDARRWYISKLLPKRYGDAVTLRGDKDNPVEVRRTERDLSDAELAAIAQGGLRGVE